MAEGTAQFAFVLGTGRCGSTLLHEVVARHPEVAFGARSTRVESNPIVFQAENDVVVLFAHRDPHVPRLRMLEGVHHTLASDVIHEQGDRGRELDVLHVTVEADRGITTHLVGERLECLRESLRAER